MYIMAIIMYRNMQRNIFVDKLMKFVVERVNGLFTYSLYKYVKYLSFSLEATYSHVTCRKNGCKLVIIVDSLHLLV